MIMSQDEGLSRGWIGGGGVRARSRRGNVTLTAEIVIPGGDVVVAGPNCISI